MRPICVILAAVGIFSMANCQAKLGETVAQIHARYGVIYESTNVMGDVTETFLFKHSLVDVTFWNGISAMESFFGAEGEDMISLEKAQLMASADAGYGSGVGDWVFDDIELDYISMHSRSSGFNLLLKGTKGGIDVMVGGGKFLEVRTEGYGSHFLELEKKAKLDFAASLSGPVKVAVPVRVLTPEELKAQAMAREKKRMEVAAGLKSAYEKAAGKGDDFAELRLGEMYRDGEGVAKDPRQAREWLAKAAAQGNHAAVKALAGLPGIGSAAEVTGK
jgi:TPR repeat protein